MILLKGFPLTCSFDEYVSYAYLNLHFHQQKKHTYEILDHLSIYYLHVSDIILQINISDPEIYL